MIHYLQGDCREVMRTLPERSVHCCVTSPPYWGLRDYGIPPTIWGGEDACKHKWDCETVATEVGKGNWSQATNGRGEVQGEVKEFREPIRAEQQRGFCRKCGAWLGVFGLEPTPELFIQHGVEVFRQVWRVLRDDGTLWLNIGDSYNSYNGNRGTASPFAGHDENVGRPSVPGGNELMAKRLKAKDLVGIPWMLAFALRADGWYLRQDIIWHKPNPMPESVNDRCTKTHEYIFLLTKSARYYFDSVAILEASVDPLGSASRYDYEFNGRNGDVICPGDAEVQRTRPNGKREFDGSRNKRSVWTVSTKPYKGAHFAVFSPDLIEPCILAGTSEEGCCGQCGSPFARITDSERVATRPGLDTKTVHKGFGDASMLQGNRDPERHVTKKTTTGWAAGCKCENPKAVPCTVLDPFGGSGTTGQVAESCGCHAILIELNPKYVALQKNRNRQAGLFTNYSLSPDEQPST